jgi:hypothetical protein
MEPFYPYIVIAIVVGIYVFFEEQADKRRIKELLAENDRLWNDVINKHQRTIAEAYQQGQPCAFTIERR